MTILSFHFDDEPYIEIQSTGELAGDVVCFHSPDGIVNGGRAN